jgi:electron transport complex protein RnfC
VTGQGVCSPQNFIARIGTPIADLIAQAGGYTALAQRLIMGGPMMGFALPSDDIPIVKTTNCILVASANETLGQKQAKPCIRCGECVSVCPASLLPQQLYWYSRAGNSQKLAEYHLADCIECGCCDVVCPSHIPLVQHFQAAKIQSSRQAQEKQRADHARFRYEAKQARTEAEKLEKAESMQRKKELLAKIAADQQKG